MERQIDLLREDEIENQINELKKDLNYDTRDYPIEFLVNLYENDQRIFAPDYQREELLWSISYKSRFIESLILDYPIPLIFLGDTQEGDLEIIDGLQRISTLAEFLNNDFELKKLTKLTTLNGCSFIDFPPSEARRLKAKALRIIVLKDSTPNESRKDLFDRLNTSSLRANASETRSGREIDNGLMKLVKELTSEYIFEKTTSLSTPLINRKEDIELISRFFAYSNNLDNYKGQVANFVDDYFVKEGDNWTEEKNKLFREEFIRTMEFIDTYFERGFRKEDKNQTPRVRFEALSVGANLALREDTNLSMSKEKANNLLTSEEFEKWTTTDGANNRKKVHARINGVKNFLLFGDFDVH